MPRASSARNLRLPQRLLLHIVMCVLVLLLVSITIDGDLPALTGTAAPIEEDNALMKRHISSSNTGIRWLV